MEKKYLVGGIVVAGVFALGVGAARSTDRTCVCITTAQLGGEPGVVGQVVLYRAWSDGEVECRVVYMDPRYVKALPAGTFPAEMFTWQPLKEPPKAKDAPEAGPNSELPEQDDRPIPIPWQEAQKKQKTGEKK